MANLTLRSLGALAATPAFGDRLGYPTPMNCGALLSAAVILLFPPVSGCRSRGHLDDRPASDYDFYLADQRFS
jgi:hypothetical protein